MKRTIILLVVNLGIIFSCKEKVKDENINVEPQDSQELVENNFQEKVIFSSFDKVEGEKNLKSDTVYVTNYWTTWCRYCVEEIPDFVALQNEYKDKKVKFIFVSIDNQEDKETKVQPFIEEHKMKNVYQISSNELSKVTEIDSRLTGKYIPVTIIQKGDKKEPFEGPVKKTDLSNKIEELLTQKGE